MSHKVVTKVSRVGEQQSLEPWDGVGGSGAWSGKWGIFPPQLLIRLSLLVEWEQHSVSGREVPPWAARKGVRGLCWTTEAGSQ